MTKISASVRKMVVERANNYCEYCLSSELITGGPLHIDHIKPKAEGGLNESTNLAYACARCNLHKGKRIQFHDPASQKQVILFNPRVHRWSHHFRWSDNGTKILGHTQIGRATIAALNMNDEKIVSSRAVWVSLGVHPP